MLFMRVSGVCSSTPKAITNKRTWMMATYFFILSQFLPY